LLAMAICTYEQNVDRIYYAMGIAMNLFVWFEMNLHTYMIVHVDNTSPNVVILQVWYFSWKLLPLRVVQLGWPTCELGTVSLKNRFFWFSLFFF
jgi:hypothetical protein